MPLPCWYNCGTNHLHQADFCLAEMKKPTMLSNKSSTAWSCAENQIFVGFLRIQSSEQDFKYLYWRISKILLWHIFTWKGIYMIDWVGRIYTSVCTCHTRHELIHMCHELIYILHDIWCSHKCEHVPYMSRTHTYLGPSVRNMCHMSVKREVVRGSHP